jgi:hypothetical protein
MGLARRFTQDGGCAYAKDGCIGSAGSDRNNGFAGQLGDGVPSSPSPPQA